MYFLCQNGAKMALVKGNGAVKIKQVKTLLAGIRDIRSKKKCQ